jgi:hypothetical protein
MLTSDFWWLSPEETKKYQYVDLFHQEPYSDEPDNRRDPLSCPILPGDKRFSLQSLSQWKTRFRNTNVFRSYALYTSAAGVKQIIGPFLLDIDRTIEGSYLPDLDAALKDTRLLVKEYCSDLQQGDYRIFFTGHKGFHIEIQPTAMGMAPHDRWQNFENRLKDINKRFGNNFVDKVHPHVRLHNSVNSWIDHSGRTIYAMSLEVSVDELSSLTADDIFAKAENLALGALNL